MIERIKVGKDLYPVELVFNRFSHASFMEALKNFANGRGHSIQGADCDFPNDIAEDEHVPPEQIDYIRLWTLIEKQREFHIPIPHFMEFLREAAAAEARLRPERAERIGELVETTARTLGAR